MYKHHAFTSSYQMESWIHGPCIHTIWKVRLSHSEPSTTRRLNVVSLVMTVRLASMIAEGGQSYICLFSASHIEQCYHI